MKLLKLKTEGFAGLPDRVYSFGADDKPYDVVLVTGGAASGKTRLLHAIIAAKEDVGSYGGPRVSCGSVAKLGATWHLSESDQYHAGSSQEAVSTESIVGELAPPAGEHPEGLMKVFSTYLRGPTSAKVELFHQSRALPNGRGAAYRAEDILSAVEARTRLTEGNEKYGHLRDFLIRMALREALMLSDELRDRGLVLRAGHATLESEIREALCPFLEGKTFDGIEPDGASYRVRFRARSGAVVDLDDLSAAEKQAIIFAVTSLRTGLQRSLVLIDTPELQQPPGSHKRFFEALTKLGGGSHQIIAATTSPEILGMVPRTQIIDLSSSKEAL